MGLLAWLARVCLVLLAMLALARATLETFGDYDAPYEFTEVLRIPKRP